MDTIIEYLRQKITKVNLLNPKANTGAKLLHEHVEYVEDIAYFARNTLQMRFNWDNVTQSVKGQTPLTATSIKIGEYALGLTEHRETGRSLTISQVRTGDLILEAFLKYDYITIQRPMDRDSSYTLHITEKFLELCKLNPATDFPGTFEEPQTDGCVIKGEEEPRNQDTVWCRSAKTLMSMPWSINTPVYEALRANQDMFTSRVKLDDELQDQRRVSKLMNMDVILTKASHWVGKVFYQTIEADYRGRLYYQEPFLNFQGSDWSRGVMQFANGEVMTKDGEYWLAVHTAASYNQSYDIDEIPSWVEIDYASYLKSEGLDSISVDKFTLNDRVRWTNENMETIISAGEHKIFADNAEKPVSFLACCIEWFNISECEGEYTSYLPIPIDGSNNGWQHLGAMSKDTRTGELVGLVATEIQRDFYVQTAKQLLEIGDEKLNAMPMKHVRKGISKRGSMTRAYSAGATTMAKNMWFDCRSEDFDKKYDIEEEDCLKYSHELIRAINTVCPGPLETMKYLQKLAAFEIGTYHKYKDGVEAGKEYKGILSEISELYNQPAEERDVERLQYLREESYKYYSVLVEGNGSKRIRWTTPSGFPVKYENWRTETFKTKGTLLGRRITHVVRVELDVPNAHGFMCGISPNYVHSMDASHMAMVIDEFNGDFGAVHDSFSTHASKVDRLLEITKRTFVDMYDVDNYYDSIQQSITRRTDNVRQPTLGSLEIQEVYDSDYFFA